ncbi:MAG: hypothetical protein QG657_4043 [Acidobacteriota bacterium]|nr:hypothetical protein [Acidobacteriota bacterium]
MLSVLLCIWIAACKPIPRNTETGTESSESFSKIYDKPDKATYTAVDIKQTEDGGYIILGKKDNYPYLLRVDGSGNFEWDKVFTASPENEEYEYSNPIPEVLIHNDEYYFFCNKTYENGDFIVMIKYNETNGSQEEILKRFSEDYEMPDLRNVFTPLHVVKQPNDRGVLLLAFTSPYDYVLLVSIDWNGDLEFEQQLEFRNYKCIYYYPLADRRFHFITRSSTSVRGMENFYNIQIYTGSDTILPCHSITRKLRSLDDPGREIWAAEFYLTKPFIAMECHEVLGEKIETGNKGKGIIKLDGIRFSGVDIEDHIITFYINSELKIDGEKTLVINKSTGKIDQQTELIESTPVYIKVMDVDGQTNIFFAGSSKNNKIVLYTYDLLKSKFLDKKYVGHTHIYEAAGLIETKDGGLAILGTTYVAGRLGRLCLFKLSIANLHIGTMTK